VGWLGYPTGPPEKSGAAWRRRFTRGLAIANPTGEAIRVPVPAGLRKLRGRQDPAHNLLVED